jgi:DNA-binding winged helix-turn-helix (wHTH) protein/Tol biopolymer transport system component
MTSDPRVVYEFGPFRMDPDKQVLLRENQPIPVTPKAFETLLALVRRSREVVTKEELLKEIWPDSFVEESNLSQNIFMLRKALGDTAENRQYIVTLPGRGYRFAAPVRTVTQGEVLVAHARSRTQIVMEENEAEADQALKTVRETTLPAKTRPRRAFYYYGAAAAVLSAALAGAFFLLRSPHADFPASKDWEQLTFFTDSAVYPALSPDGRMLAFIRGSDSFLGPGQIYVKLLSGGEPVQLTNDSRTKLAPAFSPDDSSIAYSVTEPWETWEVPVLGGEPHLLMPNSSSLTWIERGKRLLFSEFREGIHLVVVSTEEDRGNSRDVYVPAGKRSMAHHSYLSPDGRWVLIVEMDSQSKIGPCRVVPYPAPGVLRTTEVKLVGPPHRTCIAGAWSTDGEWIYLTASDEPGGIGRAGWLSAAGSHIWRQRFPGGEPEQVTFGPTSQEGIAMAPDGKSLITSVGTQDRTVWMHDKDGEHQISSEGNASSPSFSSDGRSLYFLMSNGQTHGEELWIKDLGSGKLERVLPGYPMQDYSVSRDGEEVAFTMSDQGSRSNIWVAPTSRRSPPVRISSAVSEDAPLLLPGGDLVFRATEGGANFLYRMKTDGSARQKISPERILDSYAVSPDGRWVMAETPGSGHEEHITLGTTKAFAVDGTGTVPLCTGYCLASWDTTGGFVYFIFPQVKDGTYALPVMRDSGLPRIPPSATSIEDITSQKAITAIPWEVESAVNPSVYAYTRLNTRRNLYRISLGD